MTYCFCHRSSFWTNWSRRSAEYYTLTNLTAVRVRDLCPGDCFPPPSALTPEIMSSKTDAICASHRHDNTSIYI